MTGPVRSPRIFGRPLWSWGGALTTRFVPDRRGTWRLRWYCWLGRRTLWPLCRWLTGHRQAAGETGYGGGGMLDVFCAYCCYPWQVPAEEMPSKAFLVDLFHGPTPEIQP